jgi:hypothetical protein
VSLIRQFAFISLYWKGFYCVRLLLGDLGVFVTVIGRFCLCYKIRRLLICVLLVGLHFNDRCTSKCNQNALWNCNTFRFICWPMF